MRYCNGTKKKFGWDYTGSTHMQELQLLLKATCLIRRLKTDVLKQLPSKIRYTCTWLSLSDQYIQPLLNEFYTSADRSLYWIQVWWKNDLRERWQLPRSWIARHCPGPKGTTRSWSTITNPVIWDWTLSGLWDSIFFSELQKIYITVVDYLVWHCIVMIFFFIYILVATSAISWRTVRSSSFTLTISAFSTQYPNFCSRRVSGSWVIEYRKLTVQHIPYDLYYRYSFNFQTHTNRW